MRNYEYYNNQLTGRNKNSRKLTNNTYLVRTDNNAIGITLHNTLIVIYTVDNKIILNSGGWKTSTTRDRINNFSPINLFVKNHVWYIKINDKIYYYTDRMSFKIEGDNIKLIGKQKEINDNTEKDLKKLKKRIKEYSELCLTKIPMKPGPGDCFFCQFVDSKTGEMIKDPEHLLMHMKEKYVVPSLVYHACKRFPISIAAQQYLQEGDNTWDFGGICSDQIKKSIYRFMCEKLI